MIIYDDINSNKKSTISVNYQNSKREKNENLGSNRLISFNDNTSLCNERENLKLSPLKRDLSE